MSFAVFLYRCAVDHLAIFFFFFNDTATTEIYTLSLHDALPIWNNLELAGEARVVRHRPWPFGHAVDAEDRKSTRLNSSHLVISYAVFCLKKKKPGREETSFQLAAV